MPVKNENTIEISFKIEGEDVSEQFTLKPSLTLDLICPERHGAVVLDFFPERLN